MKKKAKNIGYMGSKPKFEGTPKDQEETQWPKFNPQEQKETHKKVTKHDEIPKPPPSGRFTNKPKRLARNKKK